MNIFTTPNKEIRKAELNQEQPLKTFQMIGLVLYAESGKKISSRTKDKTKGENLLRGNGQIQIVSGYFYFLNKNIMLIINVVSLMQKYRIMHNKATTSSNFLLYPVISFLLMFGLLIAGCSDNENEEELPAPDVPDYSTIIVKGIQNMPKNFTFDRVEVKVTGLDWQVIETLIFPYENGQIVMTLPATFPSERLQKVDRRNGDMAGYWTGTSNDGDALVATLGDFFVFNGDTRVGRIALSNWSGKGSSAEKQHW